MEMAKTGQYHTVRVDLVLHCILGTMGILAQKFHPKTSLIFPL